MNYDLIILGAGPGGYLLAERVGKKMKTAIIEKDQFGGTCLNVGCIPSKAILYSKKVFDYATHSSDYGVNVKDVQYDHEKVVARKDEKVSILVKGVEAKVKANKVDIYRGFGKIIKKVQEGIHVSVNDQVLITQKLVIATGSVSSIPPIEGLKEKIDQKDPNILTNIEVLSLKELPKNLLIIGGGVIGLEMGAYFRNLVPEINIVEFLPNIAGPTDLEISNELLKYYDNKGINFHLSSSVTKIEDQKVIVKDLKTNESKEIFYDKVLLATGRKPFIENIGLENLNIAIERGAIVVDEKCKTNVANVFAIGDVNGKSMLAHTAYREADVVYSQLMGNTYDYVDYNTIPSVIYTQPEMAGVGKTEEQLQAEKIAYKVRKMPLLYSGRFVSEIDDYQGLIKMLIDKNTNQILGVHIFGQYATEIISIAGTMVSKTMTVDLVKDVVMPHPTVAELIKDLIMMEDK